MFCKIIMLFYVKINKLKPTTNTINIVRNPKYFIVFLEKYIHFTYNLLYTLETNTICLIIFRFYIYIHYT